MTDFLQIKSNKNIDLTSLENLPGKGVQALFQGEKYLVGNFTLIQEHAVEIQKMFLEKTEQWLQQAYTLVYFSNSREVLAVIAITDKIKEHAADAIQQLHSLGIEVTMLTGDNDSTAKAVAEQVGILQYKGNVLPYEKQQFVIDLQKKGMKVAMVGDGINDSQALAQADVSIAMGKGSDIAIDVAKITLLTSDLTVIPQAIRLSSATVKIIRQNLFWAFIYNLIGIPIAGGILYPI